MRIDSVGAVGARPAPLIELPSPRRDAAPPATGQTTWLPEDRAKVDEYIHDAMAAHGNDVEAAWNSLVLKRRQPENFYDPNLASAADCLRARWETVRYGPTVETARVDAYLELKRDGLIPRSGPGPVSPYSQMQDDYMHQGIADGVQDLKAAGIEPPNVLEGGLRAALEDGPDGTEAIDGGEGESLERRSESLPTTLLHAGVAVAEAPARLYQTLFG